MIVSKRILAISLVLVTGTAVLQAQEPDWATMSYTLHEDYQAVDSNGEATFPLASGAVKMRGIMLHRASDMLDGTPGSNPFMGGQWQFFFEAVDLGDTSDDDNTFGGTVCYMGQNIGKIIGFHPGGSYTDTEWEAELDRLDFDPSTGHRFQPGDLVEIRARGPGLFFRGKTNINEKHLKTPANDFDVILLQADYGLPTPEIITLADVKNGSDGFIFDSTRATGCEHYQGEAIQFNNVSFVSTTNWGPGGSLTITDGTRTFPVRLGLGSGFSNYPPPTAPFDIVGIMDQEDADGLDGYKHGYRLWAMDFDGTDFQLVRYAKPDFDTDGDVDEDDLMHLQTCTTGPAIPITLPSCMDTDLDGDNDADSSDFGIWQKCLSGDELADPDCHLD
jgi:hypothetical protein